MRMARLLGLALGLLVAVVLAACAPMDPPTKDDSPTDKEPPADGERLVLMPKPVPKPTGPQQRIEAAIQHVKERDLLTNVGFWTVFHGILGLGPSVTLLNPDTNQRVNAVDYICKGGELPGLEFVLTRNRGVDVRSLPGGGVGQGHQDQFIAEMAQWNMPADRPFLIDGEERTFLDFIRHSQMRASLKKNQELSWALVVIGQYLGTDISWTNSFGEKLHFEDLVRYELDASIENAACGGTHRLFGLTWVYHLHLQKGGVTTGVWREVAEKTTKYRDLAKQYQNRDGSFSTNHFREPGNAADRGHRISTTGHILEWLALALPEEELKEQWMQDAANALALLILESQGAPLEGGALYHATHGLLIYYARVYDRQALGANNPFTPLPPQWTKGK